MILICPLCKSQFTKHEKHYACVNNHCFDISKQGYVNLLLCDQKKTLNPGDNKEMVNSRLGFLNQDHYLAISDKLNAVIVDNLNNDNQLVRIADLGCGVGYYLKKLKMALDAFEGKKFEYYGFDISKDAIAKAAKTSNVSWVVSSTKNLPIANGSIDIILCIFAPFYLDEMQRILNPNGRIYIVTPGNNHLVELKELLYEEINISKGENILEKTQEYLALDNCENVTYSLMLNSTEDILNLFKMTPFYWKMSAQKQAALSSINQLCVTIDMKLWSFVLK
ncbi:MAG: putative RNA methyltransferase [Candidatus Berkiella sp.]